MPPDLLCDLGKQVSGVPEVSGCRGDTQWSEVGDVDRREEGVLVFVIG